MPDQKPANDPSPPAPPIDPKPSHEDVVKQLDALKSQSVTGKDGKAIGTWYDYYMKALKVTKFMKRGEEIMIGAAGLLVKHLGSAEHALWAKFYKAFFAFVHDLHQGIYNNLNHLRTKGPGDLADASELLLPAEPLEQADLTQLKEESDLTTYWTAFKPVAGIITNLIPNFGQVKPGMMLSYEQLWNALIQAGDDFFKGYKDDNVKVHQSVHVTSVSGAFLMAVHTRIEVEDYLPPAPLVESDGETLETR